MDISTIKARLGRAKKVIVQVFTWSLSIFFGLAALAHVLDWGKSHSQDWIEGDPYMKVWVNPAAKVYYPPDAKAWGNTIPGYYASQAEARETGNKSTHWWNIGYGSNPRPLSTKRDLTPFKDSRVIWGVGSITLNLQNDSDWNIRDITIWTEEEGATKKNSYHCSGSAEPRSFASWTCPSADLPPEKKWTWGFVTVKGFESK